jgi:hypothetical protein
MQFAQQSAKVSQNIYFDYFDFSSQSKLEKLPSLIVGMQSKEIYGNYMSK